MKRTMILACARSVAQILPSTFAQSAKSTVSTSAPAVVLTLSPDHVTTAPDGDFKILIKWINNTNKTMWCGPRASNDRFDETVDDQFIYDVRASDGRLVVRTAPKGPYHPDFTDECAVAPNGESSYDGSVGCVMCAYDMRHPAYIRFRFRFQTLLTLARCSALQTQ